MKPKNMKNSTQGKVEVDILENRALRKSLIGSHDSADAERQAGKLLRQLSVLCYETEDGNGDDPVWVETEEVVLR